MFSKFKQASDMQNVALKDLSDDQLSEVAGGHAHRHHPKPHHHPMRKGTKPPTMTMPTTPTTPTTMPTTPANVIYPAGVHW